MIVLAFLRRIITNNYDLMTIRYIIWL